MRRFRVPSGVIVFALVWLFVLLLPPLREILSAHAFSVHQVWPSANIPEMVRRFPNDPRVLALQIPDYYSEEADNGSPTRRIKRQLKQYDALIQRFPRENWLRARRLIFVMGGSIDMDYEGAPRRRKRILDAEILQSSLRCALDGAAVAPDNAFFSWMEAILRFGLGQNAKGVAALQHASHQTQWEDFVQAGARQQLAVLSLDHPLLFEEKLGISWGILLSHYGQMEKARQAGLQQALNAEKRGDNKGAVEIAAAVLGAIAVFREHTDTHIGLLNGERWLQKTLETFDQEAGFKTKRATEMFWPERHAYTVALARNFATFARRNQREDVARRVIAAAGRPLSPLLGNNSHEEFWDEFGLREPWSRVAFQGVWFCAQMAALAKFFALFWLAAKVFSVVWHRKHPREVAALPTRGQIARSANFALWAMLGFGALAAYFGVGFLFGTVGWVPRFDLTTTEQINAVLTGSPLYVALFAWLLPIFFTLWTRNRRWIRPAPRRKAPRLLSRRAVWTRAVLWTGALIFGALFYSNGHDLWDETVFQWPRPFIAAAVCLGAAVVVEFRLGLPFLWPSLGRLEKQAQPQPWLFVARLARSSAGVLAVVWSLCFLGGAVGMWPLRAQINRTLEHRIAIGEIAWQLEQSATRKQD